MKVGILSLTSGCNYGGTLQCIALQQVLLDMGHEVLVIDYRPGPQAPSRWWRGWGLGGPNRLRNVRLKGYKLAKLPRFLAKYGAFKARHIRFSPPCYQRSDIAQVLAPLDAVVVGSDQVWNLVYHLDPIFYLRDFLSFSGRRISYAACCGNKLQTTPDWVGPSLEQFDSVSVRDPFTAEWVGHATAGAVSPCIVADPTLLVGDYPRRAIDLPEKYVVVYLLGRNDPKVHEKLVRKIRARNGDIPVVVLMPTACSIQFWSWADKVMWNLDPYEWVECIRRSSCLYTDSFHGVLFAIRFRVEFFAVYFEKIRSSRLIEVARQFGVDRRILDGSAMDVDIPCDCPVPWDAVEAVNRSLVRSSIAFLENALK